MKHHYQKAKSNRARFLPVALLMVLVAGLGLSAQHFSSATASTSAPELYLSPATESVTEGSTVNVSVLVNTASDSINWAQSILSYSSSLLTYDSITANSNLFSATAPVLGTGTVQFGYSAMAGSSVSGAQTVATATFTAKAAGTASVSLAGVCPSGSYALTCSAVYDSTTSNNDLASVAGASYVINAPVTTTTPPTNTGGGTGSGGIPTVPTKPVTTTTTNKGSSGAPSTSSTTSKPSSSSPSTTSSSSQSNSTGPASSSSGSSAPTTTASAAPGAPNISGVSVGNVTNSSVVISWQTDQASTSVVTYGLSPVLGLSAQDATAVTSHSITLTGLATGNAYYYDVTSAVGSAASTSAQQTFNTVGFGITVKVVDKSGKPIANAIVTIGNQKAKTDSNGDAHLTNILSGDQTLVIKSGSKVTHKQLTVGQVNPATGTYESQSFSLTAARGSNYTALYALIVLVAVIVCLPIFGRPYISKLLQRRWGLAPQPVGIEAEAPVYTTNNPAPSAPKFMSNPTQTTSGQVVAPGQSLDPKVKSAEINGHLNNIHNSSVPTPGATISPRDDSSSDDKF
jgi:hypothetical protein